MTTGASKVIIEEEAPRTPQVNGVPTTVLGGVGIAPRGPVGVAVQTTSLDEFERIFGGSNVNGSLIHTARGFYAERGGGGSAWWVRTVHYTDVSDPETKTSSQASGTIETGETAPSAGTVVSSNVEPFQLAHGDTLVVAVDGAGGSTATFSATAAERETSGAGPYVLANNQTLQVSVNGGSAVTITFTTAAFVDITAATRAEVAAVINAALPGGSAIDTGTKVKIRTDKKGTGASINVVGGSANTGLVFTTGSVAGTGNVPDISAVTVAQLKTVVEAAVTGCTVTSAAGATRISSNTTGASSSIQVQASATADDELGFDNAVHSGSDGDAQDTLGVEGKTDGTYAAALQVRVKDSTDGVAEEFDIQIVSEGATINTFPNLTMDEDGERYVVTVLNHETTGSQLLAFEDLGLTGTALERRPANGIYSLTGGSDGLSSLADVDFIGSSVGKTGMYALDTVDDLSLLAVPDRATAAVHNAMISYCSVWRKLQVFPVLDPPAGKTAAEMVDYVVNTAALQESSEFGAIFWPRVKIANPSQAIYGRSETIVVPPSGIIAGIMARTDTLQGGVYKAPAGEERGIMTTVLGFETDEVLDERKRDLVYPKRINPLCTETGKPRYIDGTRTLRSKGNFPSIPERRGAIYIEQSLRRGTGFARHGGTSADDRARIERASKTFLLLQMRDGAFRSMDPDKAFFVDVGEGLNPPAVAFQGIINVGVGLAMNKPADFVIFRFSQDTRDLQASQA